MHINETLSRSKKNIKSNLSSCPYQLQQQITIHKQKMRNRSNNVNKLQQNTIKITQQLKVKLQHKLEAKKKKSWPRLKSQRHLSLGEKETFKTTGIGHTESPEISQFQAINNKRNKNRWKFNFCCCFLLQLVSVVVVEVFFLLPFFFSFCF